MKTQLKKAFEPWKKRKGSGTCSAQQRAHRFGVGMEEPPRRLGSASSCGCAERGTELLARVSGTACLQTAISLARAARERGRGPSFGGAFGQLARRRRQLLKCL